MIGIADNTANKQMIRPVFSFYLFYMWIIELVDKNFESFFLGNPSKRGLNIG